nr:hypothetical protein [Tanacetum cinerariifolium]
LYPQLKVMNSLSNYTTSDESKQGIQQLVLTVVFVVQAQVVHIFNIVLIQILKVGLRKALCQRKLLPDHPYLFVLDMVAWMKSLLQTFNALLYFVSSHPFSPQEEHHHQDGHHDRGSGRHLSLAGYLDEEALVDLEIFDVFLPFHTLLPQEEHHHPDVYHDRTCERHRTCKSQLRPKTFHA